ncbi:hut operon positive regulator HutP [Anoxybacter fermentans]|uniref:Hut operon positive regulatory protein n=1 Tax=Anoxybacter fermentans TaxID=1323375 RepID=A0A3S9T276_9FIRM|nr:HutP family protein [Anoxybacter fermentans]AZR74640.1 hut operon positive regulator HutP [Anoxybacter fermentans]
MTIESIDVAKAAIKLAISTRDEEKKLKEELKKSGIKAAAVDFGGDYFSSIRKIIERAIIAAKREGVIPDTHLGEGAVAGAAKEALAQISPRAEGFDVGGKIAITRSGEHLSVAAFFAIGLVHLNDVVIGLGHRSVYAD